MIIFAHPNLRGMKKVVLNSAILAVCTLVSCSKKSETLSDFESGRIQVETNQSTLNNRVTLHNEPLVVNNGEKASWGSYTLIAEVSAPKNTNGVQMSASNIDVIEAYRFEARAYISYHTRGESYGGGIDVINVDSEIAPFIESTIKFTDTDINDANMHYLSGFAESGERLWSLYIAGERDLSSSKYDGSLTKGAIYGELITSDALITDDYTEIPLPGYSANSIQRQENYMFASTGFSEGGTHVIGMYSYQEDLILKSFSHGKGKAVSMNHFRENQVVSLEGGLNAKLHVIDINGENFTISKSIDIGSIGPDNGKASLVVKDSYAFVATGTNGIKVVDLTSGSILNTFQLKGGNCNNLCIDDAGEYLYLAYGANGIVIIQVADFITGEAFDYATIDFEGSANGVDVNGNYVFVSSGSSGLKIVKKN